MGWLKFTNKPPLDLTDYRRCLMEALSAARDKYVERRKEQKQGVIYGNLMKDYDAGWEKGEEKEEKEGIWDLQNGPRCYFWKFGPTTFGKGFFMK